MNQFELVKSPGATPVSPQISAIEDIHGAVTQPDNYSFEDSLAPTEPKLGGVALLQQTVEIVKIQPDEITTAVDDRAQELTVAPLEVTDESADIDAQSMADNGENLSPKPILDDYQTELVMSHMKLTSFVARRFANRGEPFDDLRQVAVLGLIKSAQRFDPDRGIQFTTYATSTMEGELKRYFRDKTWAVRVPRRPQELSLRLAKAQEVLAQKFKREPTLSELALELETDEETVTKAFTVKNSYRAASLDVPVGPGYGDTNLGDTVDQKSDEYAVADIKILIANLVEDLPTREKTIIKARFGMPPFDYPHTQTEISSIVGISQMHVSRTITKTLAKLRERASED